MLSWVFEVLAKPMQSRNVKELPSHCHHLVGFTNRYKIVCDLLLFRRLGHYGEYRSRYTEKLCTVCNYVGLLHLPIKNSAK